MGRYVAAHRRRWQQPDNIEVKAIGGSDHSAATVAAGNGPFAVALNPVTNMVYVANGFSDHGFDLGNPGQGHGEFG